MALRFGFNTMLIIRGIKPNDIESISRLHYENLKEGIIAHLGTDFLSAFYNESILHENIFTHIAQKDKEIVGFVTGAVNLNSVPSVMIRKLWIHALIALLKKPLLIPKILQIPFYPSFQKNNNSGEIFTLVVKPGHRRQGIGTKLVTRLVEEFKKKKCKFYLISIRKRLTTGNNFYRSLALRQKYITKFMGEEIIFYEGKV